MSVSNTFQRVQIHAFWLLITCLMLSQCRPLLYSWSNDPGNRFGGWICTMWFVASIIHWRYLPATWPVGLVLMSIVTAGLFLLGLVGELMALIYLGTAGFLLLPIVSLKLRVGLVLMGLLWMPAWAWILAGKLQATAPWISLLLAGGGLCLSIWVRLSRFK